MRKENTPTKIPSILDSIRRIVQLLRESSREAEKRLGISGAQLFVLQRLSGAGRLSLNEVAQRTFTHQSSVSMVIQRLAERGLVQRNPNPKDARYLELKLTSRGRKILRRSPPPAQERLVSALTRLSSSRRDQLEKALREVIAHIEPSGRRPEMFFEEKEGPKHRTRKRGRARPLPAVRS